MVKSTMKFKIQACNVYSFWYGEKRYNKIVKIFRKQWYLLLILM